MTRHTIRRARRDKKNPYFMMHRDTAQDTTLSYEARGMMAYLLSKPDDWLVKVDNLILEAVGDKPTKAGKSKIYSILKELADAQYIKQPKRYKDDKGKWEWTPYEIFERPYPDLPYMADPDTGEPYTGRPDTGKPDNIQSKESQSKEEQNKEDKTKRTTEPLVLMPDAATDDPPSNGSRRSNDEVTIADVFEAFDKNITSDMTDILRDLITDACKEFDPAHILYAITEAVAHNKRYWSYINGILKNWRKDGKPSLGPSKAHAPVDYAKDATPADLPTPPPVPEPAPLPIVTEHLTVECFEGVYKTPRDVWAMIIPSVKNLYKDDRIEQLVLIDYDAESKTFIAIAPNDDLRTLFLSWRGLTKDIAWWGDAEATLTIKLPDELTQEDAA